jgi:hypothetical protein
MTDFVVDMGAGGGFTYPTPSAVYTDVAAITGGTNLITSTDRILVDTFSDGGPIVDNFIAQGVTQNDTYKIIFRKAADSAGRPQFTSAAGVTAWIRDSFVSFEEIDFDSTSASVSDAAIRLGNTGVVPEGNLFRNPLITTSSAFGVRVNNDAIGSALAPIRFLNPEMKKSTLAGPIFGLQQIFLGTPLNWYLQIVNGTFTGGESSFSYRQSDAGSLFRLELVNTECFGYFGSNAWVINTAALGTLDTSGSGFNYSKDAADILPGLAALNPVTLTSNPTPGPGNFFIVQDATAFANMRPQDVPDNDMLGAGVGPAANALVPTYDFDGNPRSGLLTTPGAFTLPTASSQSNNPLMLGMAL